ncbi:MAG: MBL fold metallo-hydrolase [Flammeovirgaceae bacterium]|nr:MBL fold metallo-hydrolase [Flammeovirgaceae bacterium]MBE63308.1 MBL fold metallo-hydrolase [Flammeovirgaceae bacterium]MBR06442.1 MBL fold metallo-hydrolase [Rickettsiales bacterium]HCX21823.1 MBL fold metallo-hydrolase [Cytophagales bacterium]
MSLPTGTNYKKMATVKFELRSAGYCTALKSHALRGTAARTIKFFATYSYLHHPTHGHILFDTGYTTRFYELTKSLPMSLYAKATKVFVKPENHASVALSKDGISPESIDKIIISHFHADHIGGLRDFPNATFICSQQAYDSIQNKTGFSALKQGFIPELLPDDFDHRVQLIHTESGKNQDIHLGPMFDLFGDGSIQLFQVEGHACGQIGALIKTEQKPVLLIADAAWLKENYLQMHLPSPIVRLFFHSWKNFKVSLKNVHNYHQANPDTLIIPCHCEATYRQLANDLTDEAQ